MKVWVLVVAAWSGDASVLSTVDNIVSEQVCQKLGQDMTAGLKEMRAVATPNFRCFEVEKAHG